MSEISGGRLVAKTLKAEGVKYVFSLPGGHIAPIYEGLIEEGIEIISMRHEQAAGNAADGWGRITRTPGVCLVTAGPGIVNLVPALAQAYYANSPVIGITGRTAFVFSDKHAFQEVDSVALARPVTKWAKTCSIVYRIPEYVQDAFRAATSGKMGPALLDFPLDTMCLLCDETKISIPSPEKYRPLGKIYGDPILVKKAAEMLLNAEKPIILAGSGVYWANASKELVELAELLQIPVMYYELGMGCIPDEHPLCIGNAVVSLRFAKPDVMLAVGVCFDELLGFGVDETMYPKDLKVIHVDIEPSIIGKNRPMDLGIIGDPKAVLSQLLEATKQILKKEEVKERTWTKKLAEIKKTFFSGFEKAGDSTAKPIRPERLMKEIREFVTSDTIVILDGGDTSVWAYTYLKAHFPGQIIGSQGPLGHLGAGIPMGIAAKLAKPEKRVFVITGDGSFLFNGAEIDTAVRYHIPFITIIANDSYWGMVYHGNVIAWKSKEKSSVGTKLNEKVRYDRFVESLGGYGEIVTEPGEIKPAIQRALKENVPAVIDVRIDPEATTILDQYFALTATPQFWKKYWTF